MPLKRPVKWILAGLIGVLVILVAAAVVLPRLIDVRQYAPLVTEQVRRLTGRTVTVGSIALRVLPTPAVTVSPVAVSEGPRYPGRDALRLKSLAIRLRVLPLLRGRIEFSTIVLENPTLSLIRDRQGRWSFDDVVERVKAAEKAAPAPGASAASKPALGVARAEIRGGRVQIFDDAVIPGTRSQATIGPLDARILDLGLGGRTTAELSARLGESVLAAVARLEDRGGASALVVELPGSRLRAADLQALFPWLGVATSKGLVTGGNLQVEGHATIPLEKMEAVAFEGKIVADGLSYKEATMARPIEKIDGHLSVNGSRAVWEGFTATLGGSRIDGRLEVEDYLRPRIGFALKSPRLDLNELVAAFPTTGGPPPKAAPGPSSRDSGAGMLGQITARGSLEVAALRVQTFDVTEVKGVAGLRDGVLTLNDLAARLYGGKVAGEAGLDLGHGAARWRLATGLDGVDVNALAAAYDPGLKDILTGRLTGRLAIEAQGDALDAILGTARGGARIAINRGSIASISMLKQLASLLEMAGGKGVGQDETPFESLAGTFAIADRRAVTSDLALDSADLDLAGSGEVGLDTRLDLDVTAQFSEEATRGMVEKTPRLQALADKDGRLTIFLKAGGTLAAPQVGLDTRAQVRQVQEQRKEQVKEKIRNRLLDLLGGQPKEEPPPEGQPPPDPPSGPR
jgi:AsmA protein